MRDPEIKQHIRQRSLLTEATLKAPHVCIHDEDPDPFVLALGLWCEEAGISRVQFRSLREILRMLEPHPIISKLQQATQYLSTTPSKSRDTIFTRTMVLRVSIDPFIQRLQGVVSRSIKISCNLGTFNLGTFNLGTFNLGTFNLGTFNLGTFNLGTCLW